MHDRPGRFGTPLAKISLGLLVGGMLAGTLASPAAASSINSNKPYARAQLLTHANLPGGWTTYGKTWVGTSNSGNAASMMTMTQYPDLSTCLGSPPALSVVAAEATGPEFDSKDGNTDVLDVADVYTSVNQAKQDFPPLSNPKFAKCFLQEQGSTITDADKGDWPTGAKLGTPIASVSHEPRYGDESGFVEVQVPVTLPGEQGTTDDFFIDMVIREGRSTAELLIDQGGTTPSATLTESLAKAVTKKMKERPPNNTVLNA